MPPAPRPKRPRRVPYSRSPRRVPYLPQIVTAIIKVSNSVPPGQTIPFDDVLEQARDNADVCVPATIIGTRFDLCAESCFRTLRRGNLIEANFELRTIQITPAGHRKFQTIREESGHTRMDEKTELVSYYCASQKQIGSPNDLTKSQLWKFNDQYLQTIGEQKDEISRLRDQVNTLEKQVPRSIDLFVPALPDEVVRRVDLLNAAGPSTSGQTSTFATPMRKTLSMDAYPSPESLPRQRGPYFGAVPPSPSPSPSPRGSFAMDVYEERELPPTGSGQGPSDTPVGSSTPIPTTSEHEANLAKGELLKTQGELAQLRARHEAAEKARRAAAESYENQIDDLECLRLLDDDILWDREDEILLLRSNHSTFRLKMDQHIAQLENAKALLEKEKYDLGKRVRALEAEKARSAELRRQKAKIAEQKLRDVKQAFQDMRDIDA